MRFIRVTRDGKKEISGLGIRGDATVGFAAAQLEARLKGGKVYMWCWRPVDAHEAFSILQHAGGDAVAEASARLNARLAPSDAKTPFRLLAALKRHGGLREALSIRNRYLVPGGYYADHGVDPFGGRGENGAAAKARGEYSAPVNLGDMLLESFGADEIYVYSKADVVSTGASAEVLDLYFPDVPDRSDYVWDFEAEERAAGLDAALPKGVSSAVTFVSLAGGSAEKRSSVTFDDMMRTFSSTRTTGRMPVMRIQGGGIETPVVRAHESAQAETLVGGRVPSSREWFQAEYSIGKGSAKLVVYPGGFYKARFSFKRTDKASVSDAAAYFADINATLAEVSPFLRPLAPEALAARASALMPKAYLLNTPQVAGGPLGGVYHWYSVPLAKSCDIHRVRRAIEEQGSPSLKVINVKSGEIYLQWMRCSGLSARAVAKNVLHRAGRVNDTLLASLSSETGIAKADLLDIAASPHDKSSAMAIVTVKVLSDSTLAVSVKNGNDANYGDRAARAVHAASKLCDARAISAPPAPLRVSTTGKIESEAPIRVGGLDEFYAYLDDGDVENDGDAGAPASAPDPSKTDVLGMLQLADPEVFAFPTEAGYSPYSVRCQKSGKRTRQPLVLSDEQLATAAEASSAAGLETLASAMKYRGNNYVCPAKWCPVGGVAVGASEPCPGGEAGWDIWDKRFPGLQPGVHHPEGLCMPCCFGTASKPGTKKHADMSKCLGLEDRLDVGKWKTAHTGKADRLLDEGSYGHAPPELFAGTATGIVRRGIGARSRATLLRAYSVAIGSTPGKVVAALGKGLRLVHAVQCDIRRFMPEGDCGGFSSAAEAASWLKENKDYAAVMGLGRVGAAQRRREWLLKLGFEELRRRLVNGEDLGDQTFYRLINSGAGDLPPVLLVTVDDAGNAFCDRAPSRAFSEPLRAAVMARRGVHEPLGTRKKSFDGMWRRDHPWILKIGGEASRHIPAGKRLVGYSIMAVAAAVGGGFYAALGAPAFVDPAFPHAYIADGATEGLSPAPERWAEERVRETGDPFYRSDWKFVTARLKTDDAIDALLFGCGASEDERDREMRALGERMASLAGIVGAIGAEADADDLAVKEGETARTAILRIKAKYGKYVTAPESDVEHAIERMIRPVPSGLFPSFKIHPDEKVVAVP